MPDHHDEPKPPYVTTTIRLPEAAWRAFIARLAQPVRAKPRLARFLRSTPICAQEVPSRHGGEKAQSPKD